jgi:hypothetical protein
MTYPSWKKLCRTKQYWTTLCICQGLTMIRWSLIHNSLMISGVTQSTPQCSACCTTLTLASPLPMGNYAAVSVCKNSKNMLNTIEGSILQHFTRIGDYVNIERFWKTEVDSVTALTDISGSYVPACPTNIRESVFRQSLWYYRSPHNPPHYIGLPGRFVGR